MSGSNSWAEFSATYGRTREAYLEHKGAKAELKKLVPKTPGRRSDTASRPSDRNLVPSALNSLPGRPQSSSDSIGALAAALAKAQVDIANSEKSLIATIVSPFPR
jgi:hypothetical protein